jgi:hypothetical protein
MGTISKLNDVLCANISKVDDILKASISKWDDNDFCPAVTPTPTPTQGVSATPTPTPTFTPTLTPTPSQTPPECPKDCCIVQLCYSSKNCEDACFCNEPVNVYLTVCTGDPCELSVAYGIFNDDFCTDPAPEGYYSDGFDCYSWFSGVITYDAPCR